MNDVNCTKGLKQSGAHWTQVSTQSFLTNHSFCLTQLKPHVFRATRLMPKPTSTDVSMKEGLFAGTVRITSVVHAVTASSVVSREPGAAPGSPARQPEKREASVETPAIFDASP